MDRFVIFNKATGKRYGMESYGGYKEWNTERAAKAALTRLKNKYIKLYDRDVTYAQEHGFFIVSKDSDFHQRSFVLGAPPKVIWIRLGNCTTEDIAHLLTHHQADLETFQDNQDGTFLELG